MNRKVQRTGARSAKFQDLPDTVLYELISYLNSVDVLNLALLDKRYEKLMHYHFKKYKIDLRPSRMCSDKFRYVRKFLPQNLDALMVRGMSRYNYLCDDAGIVRNLLQHSNLTVLALENICINANSVKQLAINTLPQTLLELSLRNTGLIGDKYFLNELFIHVPNLRTLLLDGCMWVDKECIESILFLPELENLSICMCKPVSLGACLQETTNYTLRRLDVRVSVVNVCELLASTRWLVGLRELYLQPPAGGSTPDRQAHMWPMVQGLSERCCVWQGRACTLRRCRPPHHVRHHISSDWHHRNCCRHLHEVLLSTDTHARSQPPRPSVLFAPRYGSCVGRIHPVHSEPDSEFQDAQDQGAHSDDSGEPIVFRYRPLKKKYRKLTRKRRQEAERQFIPWTLRKSPPRDKSLSVHPQLVCPQNMHLEVLCLRDMLSISRGCLQQLYAATPNLSVLDLTGTDIEASDLQIISQWPVHVVHPALCDCKVLPLKT